jgi:hypothetical protein
LALADAFGPLGVLVPQLHKYLLKRRGFLRLLQYASKKRFCFDVPSHGPLAGNGLLVYQDDGHQVPTDFPLLLNDDRIAKMVFQKSPEGRAMLDKAFEAWRVEAPPSPAALPSSTSLPAKQARPSHPC